MGMVVYDDAPSDDISFSDGSSVFGKADVEVSQTDPVTIDVRFLPAAGPPAKSFAPGPTIAFGALPSARLVACGLSFGTRAARGNAHRFGRDWLNRLCALLGLDRPPLL